MIVMVVLHMHIYEKHMTNNYIFGLFKTYEKHILEFDLRIKVLGAFRTCNSNTDIKIVISHQITLLLKTKKEKNVDNYQHSLLGRMS